MANTAYQSSYTGAEIDAGIGKANTAYQKPSTGIPPSDLATGIPSTKFDSTTQISLSEGHAAYESLNSKADKSATVSTVSYDTTLKKITKTINGSTTDVVTASTIVTDGGGITTETDPVFSASAASGITSSDITNWNSKTSNTGTITGITMNGASKGTSGVVDLGTVITAHQDISGKADKSATVSTVTYNTTSKKITKTINGTTSDVVTAAKIVTDGGGITSHQDISGKADKATTLAGYGITDAKIASGVITLGSNTITPVTDVSGKADKSATVSTVTYDTTNKKLRKTINGTTTDIVTASTIVTDGGGIKSHQSVVLATGTNDGTMKITVNGSATDNVAVKGFADLVARVVTLEQNSVFYKGHYLTSNSPYAKNSAVYFNGRMFVSNAQTSDTPMPVYTNSAGNRLVLSDGGYIIASTTLSSNWEEKYE